MVELRVRMQEISEAIAKRSGAILSPYTILKADVYPSLYNANVPQLFPGAPNFRQADGDVPVFGMGIPTREGIINVLDEVGAGPENHDGDDRCAVCTNLREEPLLYINGTPYVLREASGAYTNMKEYRRALMLHLVAPQLFVQHGLRVLCEPRLCGCI